MKTLNDFFKTKKSGKGLDEVETSKTVVETTDKTAQKEKLWIESKEEIKNWKNLGETRV